MPIHEVTLRGVDEKGEKLMEDKAKQDIICPFCGQTDFDLTGLKHHLQMGHCDIFNNAETEQEERERLRKGKEKS